MKSSSFKDGEQQNVFAKKTKPVTVKNKPVMTPDKNQGSHGKTEESFGWLWSRGGGQTTDHPET